MILLRQLLIEAREDHIAQQMGNKLLSAYEKDNGTKPKLATPLEIVKYLMTASTSYIQWVANQYVKGNFKLEDVPRIGRELTEFNRVKPKLEVKDINKYASLRDLYAALKPLEDTEVVSNNKKEKELLKTGAKKLIDSPQLTMYRVLNKEGAVLLGRGTRWCTAATTSENMFDEYNSEGPLFVVIDKTHNEKFQIHAESESLMDAEDMPVDPNWFFKQYPSVITTITDDNIKGMVNWLSKWREGIGFLPEDAIIAILPYEVELLYYLPKEKFTKKIVDWMMKYDYALDKFHLLPDKFKTFDLCVRYVEKEQPRTLEAIPTKFIPDVQKFIKTKQKFQDLVQDTKALKKIATRASNNPDNQAPERQELIKDLNTELSDNNKQIKSLADYFYKITRQHKIKEPA